jgi:hypothetical protein
MISDLPQLRHLAPAKKFRNPKRYFRKAMRSAERFQISITDDDWWAWWHYHADWQGYGNLSWEVRIEYLRALATVFRKIADQSRNYKKPFQLWIYLCGSDAGQDAVYLHTANENGTPFPFVGAGFDWAEHPFLKVISELLPEFRLRVGRAPLSETPEVSAVARNLYIYAIDLGAPLEDLTVTR